MTQDRYHRPLGLQLRAYYAYRRHELDCLGPDGYAHRLPPEAQQWLSEHLLTEVARNAARLAKLGPTVRRALHREDYARRQDVTARGLVVPLEGLEEVPE